MAPEIINNQTYRGSKADIWALGVSTYCMIFNKLPFDSQDNLEHLILNQEIDLTGRQISVGLLNVLLRMLDRDPASRQSAK